MPTQQEVVNHLESEVSDSVDWVIDFTTNRYDTSSGYLDRCYARNVHGHPRHEWSLVTVDLTWYANTISKGALAGILIYYGVKVAAAATLWRAITIGSAIALIKRVGQADSYTFGGVEYDYDHPFDSDPYPAFKAVGGVGWDEPRGSLTTVAGWAGHPTE